MVGATGSIGRLVVKEAIRYGYATRALVRDPGKARRLPPEAGVIVGGVTRPETLSPAVDGVDAMVFTLRVRRHRQGGGGERRLRRGAQRPEGSLGSRTARIALMTSIGVTNRNGAYNRATSARLEAPLGAAAAGQRFAVYDLATRLVRLRQSGRAPARPSPG